MLFISELIKSNGDENVYCTYPYKKGKDGLVKTKKERNNGYNFVRVYEYFYSDIKTDVKTYSLFISGFDDCYGNANL